MLGAIIWGALSAISFGLFIAVPSEQSGFNYMLLVPAFLSLAGCMILSSPFRARATRNSAGYAPSLYDDMAIARTEKLKSEKLKEDARLLRSQSSRHRTARH